MKPKTLSLINQLLDKKKNDTKKSAFDFFNKCDYADLVNTGLCLVEMERCDSFVEYAKSKGTNPSGGAFSLDMKSQYFYI